MTTPTKKELADAFRQQANAMVAFEGVLDTLKPSSASRIRKAYATARHDGHPVLASIDIATKQITPEDRR